MSIWKKRTQFKPRCIVLKSKYILRFCFCQPEKEALILFLSTDTAKYSTTERSTKRYAASFGISMMRSFRSSKIPRCCYRFSVATPFVIPLLRGYAKRVLCFRLCQRFDYTRNLCLCNQRLQKRCVCRARCLFPKRQVCSIQFRGIRKPISQ